MLNLPPSLKQSYLILTTGLKYSNSLEQNVSRQTIVSFCKKNYQTTFLISPDIVLTSKHHEGWCNFPSAQHWNWNSMTIGPNMDLVANLSASVRAQGLHMGLYHSLREWYNPLYIQVLNY